MRNTISCVTVLLFQPALVLAQFPPIVPFDPSTAWFDEYQANAMIGWTFHVKSTITITQIGWYDQDQDGLSRAFEVGLWQDLSGGYFSNAANANNLAYEIIPAGTAAKLNGIYRVVDFAVPLILVPADYELVGLTSAASIDVVKYKGPTGSSEFNGPQVDVRQFIWSPHSDPYPYFHLVTRDSFYPLDGLEIGPMLFMVPEPSMGAVLFVGGLGTMAWRRRRGPLKMAR